MKHSFKKLALLGSSSLACFLISQTAQAEAYGDAGCGLGSVVFDKSPHVWWKQVFAATTNGTFGIQTFAITSGTSNCGPGITGKREAQKDYVTANLVSLQREAAQGSGSTIEGLASVLGCSSASYEQFGAYTQANYEHIFNSKQPEAVLSNLKSQIGKNSQLSGACSLVNI